uniref:Uncharacterized protein n=1 Tax=Monopterus albus TaxID=43700 RepID=A0A3Q3QBD2_MONAL
MSFFGFGQSAEIDVVLSDAETRKKAEHKTEDGKKDKYFLFYDGETVSGKVNVTGASICLVLFDQNFNYPKIMIFTMLYN